MLCVFFFVPFNKKMACFSGGGLGIFLPNVLGIKLGPVASLNHLEVRQKATKTTRKRRSVAWTKRKQHDQMMTETYFPLKLINSKKLSAELETGGVGVFVQSTFPGLIFQGEGTWP